MLEIKDLQAGVEGKQILRGIDLRVNPGEVHAIMGPNGSGKSTLAQILAGRDTFDITAGEVLYDDRNLLDMPPEGRARAGIFLAFQYPVVIAGVTNAYFMKAAVNAVRKERGLDELDALDFLKLARDQLSLVEMDESFLNRSVNHGFSGGEMKRNEIFQMAMLAPRLAVLDETDSGLDIDALQIVANGVNALRGPDRAIIVITHYQRLLTYLVPDHTHVLMGGRLVKSGGRELAVELERRGYRWIEEELGAAGAATAGNAAGSGSSVAGASAGASAGAPAGAPKRWGTRE